MENSSIDSVAHDRLRWANLNILILLLLHKWWNSDQINEFESDNTRVYFSIEIEILTITPLKIWSVSISVGEDRNLYLAIEYSLMEKSNSFRDCIFFIVEYSASSVNLC